MISQKQGQTDKWSHGVFSLIHVRPQAPRTGPLRVARPGPVRRQVRASGGVEFPRFSGRRSLRRSGPGGRGPRRREARLRVTLRAENDRTRADARGAGRSSACSIGSTAYEESARAEGLRRAPLREVPVEPRAPERGPPSPSGRSATRGDLRAASGPPPFTSWPSPHVPPKICGTVSFRPGSWALKVLNPGDLDRSADAMLSRRRRCHRRLCSEASQMRPISRDPRRSRTLTRAVPRRRPSASAGPDA